jgi:hypothetical protein
VSLFVKAKNGYKRILDSISGSPVLVYQMGKVGSSSVGASIPRSAHLHTLYGNPPCEAVYDTERRGFMMVAGWVYDFIRRVVIRSRKDVKIISIIRTPIERNVSMYFQDFPYWYVRHRKEHPEISRFSGGTLVEDIYVKTFPHMYVDEWFDKEIRRLTGIDVYSEAFDLDSGYQIYERGKYKWLVIKLEKIQDRWADIQDFVGEKIVLENKNMSENKWYKPIYDLHKKTLLENKAISDLVKSGKFYKHFYR